MTAPDIRRFSRNSLQRGLGLALALLAVGMLSDAAAAGRGGGRLAESSVAGANRVAPGASRGATGTTGRTVGRNAVGNDINIGNDVDIDIDGGYNHHWDDHVRYPGLVIGAVAVTTAAVAGSYYYRLPTSCTVVIRDGVSYHYCGSVYYHQRWYGNDVVYVVVDL